MWLDCAAAHNREVPTGVAISNAILPQQLSKVRVDQVRLAAGVNEHINV
jgi:hypothetical protein